MPLRTVEDIAQNAILSMAMHEPSANPSEDQRVNTLSNVISDTLSSERQHIAELVEDFSVMESLPELSHTEALCDAIADMIRDRDRTTDAAFRHPAANLKPIVVELYIPHSVFLIRDNIIEDIIYDNPGDLPIDELIGRDWRTIMDVDQSAKLCEIANEVRSSGSTEPKIAFVRVEKGEARDFRLLIQTSARGKYLVIRAQVKVMQPARVKHQNASVLAVV